jgi:flavin-binding protein dodecin
MAVARTTEIVAGSPDGFKAAMKAGIARATKTLDNVTGAWIQDQELVIDNGKIKEYRVRMKVTFVLKD